MLGQKFEITLVATFIDFKNFTSWTSVFHYLDPSLPLLKSGHGKLRALVLVNLFSMVGVRGATPYRSIMTPPCYMNQVGMTFCK